ncbi:hypothetical protein FS749_003334 [Ceratobasidium sp. UAMH 11750]|nr:hypothetical protein FS749_003334 [Ceratobasidium sp. UAMH 11750]
MVRMNYNPRAPASITRQISLPLETTENLMAVREEVNRILQLAEIVCPDEFQAYRRLLKPYWGLLRSWRRQGLLDGKDEYLISLAEDIESYRQFHLEDMWKNDPNDPYRENMMDEMMMERTRRTIRRA